MDTTSEYNFEDKKMKLNAQFNIYDRDEGDTPKLAFSRQDLFLTDFSLEAEYKSDRRPFGVHHGHWKLTVADMELLNYFWNPQEVSEPVMVVAGGAPGVHFGVILRLYPEIKELHIYDTNRFFTEKPRRSEYADEFRGKIFLHKKYFDLEEAKKWAGRKDVFFTSDVRSVSHEDLTAQKYYEAILNDNKMQEEWVRAMDPVAAMLKFKVPILKEEGGIKRSIPYKGMDGFIFRGVWSRERTTECRLVPVKVDGKYVERIWDDEIFRKQNMFYNYFKRIKGAYINPYTGTTEPVLKGTLENDFDSLATVYVIDDYLRKVGIEVIDANHIILIYNYIMSTIQDITENNVSIADLRASEFKSSRIPSENDVKDYKQWGVDPIKENKNLFEDKFRYVPKPEGKIGGVPKKKSKEVLALPKVELKGKKIVKRAPPARK